MPFRLSLDESLSDIHLSNSTINTQLALSSKSARSNTTSSVVMLGDTSVILKKGPGGAVHISQYVSSGGPVTLSKWTNHENILNLPQHLLVILEIPRLHASLLSFTLQSHCPSCPIFSISLYRVKKHLSRHYLGCWLTTEEVVLKREYGVIYCKLLLVLHPTCIYSCTDKWCIHVQCWQSAVLEHIKFVLHIGRN